MTLLIGSPTYLTSIRFDDVPLEKERRFEPYIHYVRFASQGIPARRLDELHGPETQFGTPGPVG